MDSNNNSHRQYIKSPPSDSDSDMRPDLALHNNHRHSRRSEKRDNGIVSAALMHACQSHSSYIFTCSEAAVATEVGKQRDTPEPVYLPTYLSTSIHLLSTYPINQSNKS